MHSYEFGLYVFMLAAFLGLELVKRVSPLLHTPLMSLSNAISAIAVVGAIAVYRRKGRLARSRACWDSSPWSAATLNVVERLPDHRPHAQDVPQEGARS